MISKSEDGKVPAPSKPGKKSKKGIASARKSAVHKTVNLVPVVVEAGSRSKSSLRHLEEGAGPLIQEIGRIVHAIQAAVPEPVPIVVVYREKQSSHSRSDSPFGLFF